MHELFIHNHKILLPRLFSSKNRNSFLTLHSGVVMLQTTNGVYNKTLYDYATPKALLAWQRVRVSNWLASGGEEWARILASFNSGLCGI